MTYFGMFRTAVESWISDRATSRGAAIAYYTVFSLAPLLLLVIAMAGLIFGREAAQGAIVRELAGMMGRQSADAIQVMIQSAADAGDGILGMLVSVPLLLLGATTVFAELQDALNQIWQAPPRKVSGLWAWIRVRILSLSLVATIGFLLIVSLIVSTLLTSMGNYLTGGSDDVPLALELLNFVVSLLVTTGFFAAIYKILPDVPIAWRDVGVGAAITAILFHIGKYVIALYVSHSDVASSYGAAGALVVVLVWVFYSAQIFLLGAEFTKAVSDRRNPGQKAAREQVARSEAGDVPAPGRPRT